jgi:hypothetical protein
MKHSPMTIANGSILCIRDEYAARSSTNKIGFKNDVYLLKRTDGSYEYHDLFDLDPTPTLLKHLHKLLEESDKREEEKTAEDEKLRRLPQECSDL